MLAENAAEADPQAPTEAAAQTSARLAVQAHGWLGRRTDQRAVDPGMSAVPGLPRQRPRKASAQISAPKGARNRRPGQRTVRHPGHRSLAVEQPAARNAAEVTAGAPRRRLTERGLGQCWGLDGVRVLAVLAVLAFHEPAGDPGGFLGVDVFFVLSGYLITDLLVARFGRDGQIGLGLFTPASRAPAAACPALTW